MAGSEEGRRVRRRVLENRADQEARKRLCNIGWTKEARDASIRVRQLKARQNAEASGGLIPLERRAAGGGGARAGQMGGTGFEYPGSAEGRRPSKGGPADGSPAGRRAQPGEEVILDGKRYVMGTDYILRDPATGQPYRGSGTAGGGVMPPPNVPGPGSAVPSATAPRRLDPGAPSLVRRGVGPRADLYDPNDFKRRAPGNYDPKGNAPSGFVAKRGTSWTPPGAGGAPAPGVRASDEGPPVLDVKPSRRLLPEGQVSGPFYTRVGEDGRLLRPPPAGRGPALPRPDDETRRRYFR